MGPYFGPPIAVEGRDGRLVDGAALARVEELDDTIFDALEGDAAALDRASRLWRGVRESAPTTLVEESREQYVRQAQAVFAEGRRFPEGNLGRAFAALEVLTMLAE